MEIVIGGDISPVSQSIPAFLPEYPEKTFGTTVPILQNADVTIVNLETVLTDCDRPLMKIGPNMKDPAKCAQTLKKAGVDICAMANNHVFDFGQEGLRDTVRAVEKAGMHYTGIGMMATDAEKPLYFEKESKTFALLCMGEHEYSYALRDRMGIWGFDPYSFVFDIQSAKQKADYVIVLYHGGKEYSPYP